MLKKPWKTITQDNGTINIYGNNHYIPLDYEVPEWNMDKPEEERDQETCFKYKGNTYFLSEIMRIEKSAPDWMQYFDGYDSHGYGFGILVKLSDDNEAVKVYTYIS